jgi:hypothetical protein
MKWIVAVSMVTLGALGTWMMPDGASSLAYDAPVTTAGSVGTSGTHEDAVEVESGDVITDIETITGANDGMSLVGRRVDLHVDVHDRVGERAFWVGPPGNRVFVVMVSDTVSETRASHRVVPVRRGQRAAVIGTIRPVAHVPAATPSSLSGDELRALDDRMIYIRAQSVSSEGHGAH